MRLVHTGILISSKLKSCIVLISDMKIDDKFNES